MSSQKWLLFLLKASQDVLSLIAKGGSEALLRIPTGDFKENYTFTELVNESIRRVKNNIPF